MHKKLFLIILYTLSTLFGFSQNVIKIDQVFGQFLEADRIQINFQFVKALVSSCKEINAFFIVMIS